MDVSEFVSMQEAVEISGYTRTMLALLCRTGKLPGAQKLGGRWLIPRKALEGYVPDPPGPKPGSKRKGAGTVKAVLEEALAQARERAREAPPPLEGTEKQIDWAGKIRAAFLSLPEPAGMERAGEGVFGAVLAEAAREASAAWWIEHRDALRPPFFHARALDRLAELFHVPYVWDAEDEEEWMRVARARVAKMSDAELLRLFLHVHGRGEGELAIFDADVQARIDDEGSRTLRPSEPKSDLLWRIEEPGDRLVLFSPARDAGVAAMVKRLGFTWSEGAWRRKRPEKDDMAVEIAVRLLAMGLPVRVPRAELVPRVAAADYAPFMSKRIIASEDREKFEAVWAWEDGNFYDVLKKIPGARWDSTRRRMTVPKDRWAEVEDFADAHGFTLSVSARQMAREAEAAMKAALVVDPRPKGPEKKAEKKV
ncbi:MAG: helix-turn-helix domain-containing protein, partial [Synergistaceae bacterium]|nr:helix-turn-helix domain-containing protein [Synergistaceae bacterium]